MNTLWKGRLATIIGAASWGLSGVCGQYLMQTAHIAPLTIISIRMLVTGLILTAYLIGRHFHKIRAFCRDKVAIFQLVVFALFGISFCQVSYLLAIQASNAGTATVLQYLSPVLVIGYFSLAKRHRPSKRLLLAISLAIGGTFLIATHGQFNQLALTPAGLWLGLFSAVGYALYTVLPEQLMRQWGSSLVTALGLLIGGVSLFIANRSWQDQIDWTPMTLAAFAGMIVVGTLVAYSLFLYGVAQIGAVEASLLAASEPVSAVIFAALLMHEAFYLMDLVGMGLIILAVGLISLQGQSGPNDAQALEI